jgi:hypothetical protein
MASALRASLAKDVTFVVAAIYLRSDDASWRTGRHSAAGRSQKVEWLA